MNHVKAVQRIGHGVGLVKLEGIMFLRLDIHANDLKACAVVAHSCPTSTAE